MIFSPKKVPGISLSLFQRDLAIDTPEARLCWSDVSAAAAPLPHSSLFFCKCLAEEEEKEEEEEEEEGFWVSRGQDVCLIILELEEIILMLKRD